MTLFKKKLPLKTQLILLSVNIIFILGMVFFNISNNLRKTIEESNFGIFKNYALQISHSISDQFYERYYDVQSFAINPIFQKKEIHEITPTLNQYATYYGIYELILFLDSTGKLIASNQISPEGKFLKTDPLYQKNYSQELWFQKSLKKEFTEDIAKKFTGTVFQDVELNDLTSEIYGEKKFNTLFSTPIKNPEGIIIGVLALCASINWIEHSLEHHFEGLKAVGYAHPKVILLGKNDNALYSHPKPKSEESSFSEKPLEEYTPPPSPKKEGAQGKLLTHTSTHESEFLGYTNISGEKFIDSIGWSVLVSVPEKEIMAFLDQMNWIFYLSFAMTMIFALVFSSYFSNGLSKKLEHITEQLNQESQAMSLSAETVSHSSSQLSEAVSRQAAAIQETAASLEQVSSMIQKSAQNSSDSKKVSQESEQNAQKGQKAVSEMIRSIQHIQESNAAIMSQVEEGNKKISEIVKVIAEIEDKTKIINDIVFQTKLLSFNASVEAARAGEHGKGFSVVAEEVGNLAQMSGNAARDISQLLESSVHKVEGIIQETKQKVEFLMVENKSKIESGIQIAEKCQKNLENIFETVQKVDHMISEIATASQEQSQGVSEINKNMNSLDQVTQKNSSISSETAQAAKNLNDRSEEIKNVVHHLSFLIHGGEEKRKELKTKREHLSLVHSTEDKKIHFSESTPLFKTEPSQVISLKKISKNNPPSHEDPRFEDI